LLPIPVACASGARAVREWFATRHRRCQWNVQVIEFPPPRARTSSSDAHAKARDHPGPRAAAGTGVGIDADSECELALPPGELELERGPSPASRFLFGPSPLLAQMLDSDVLDEVASESARAGALPRALDVGAGSGRDCIILATRGWAVTALDRDKRALGRWETLAVKQGVETACTAVIATLREEGDLVRSLEAAACNPIHCDPPESPTFQLVMLCRTLHRPTLAELATLLAPGGVLLIHHFLEGNTHPTHPDAVLRHGELREMFHSELEIVLDEQRAIEDGRVLTFFVARRRPKAP